MMVVVVQCHDCEENVNVVLHLSSISSHITSSRPIVVENLSQTQV